MKHNRSLWAIVLVVSGASLGAASDFSKFLHSVFEQHAGRQPSGTELNYQANVMRNQGPLESYITLFASDDYFTTRAQRSYEIYVQNLYRTFLMRDARPDEVRYWVDQFAQPGADRQSTLRSFVRTYHVTQLPSFPAEYRPTPYRVPASAAEIASELVAQVNLFRQTFQREVGGTLYGRGVLDDASRLLTVSSQYRDVLRSSATTAEQCRIAADNLEQALQRLEGSYCRISGVSQMSRQILGRISQLVSAARLAHQGGSNPGGGSGGQSDDRAELYRQVETVRGQLQSYLYGLRHYRSTPDYDRLYRDVQSLSVQVDALSLMVRQGQSGPRLRRTVGSVLSEADTVSRDVGRVDLTIQQGWWTIEHSLDRVAQTAGVSHTWSDVGQPVILGNPVWQRLGTQPRPAVGIPGRNRDVVDLADQLLAKIDDARQSLAPLAGRDADTARLRASVTQLRNQVQVLRQIAASNLYGSRLARAADQTMEQYQETSKLFAAAVGRDPTLNTPTFYQMGELIQRLRKAASGVPQ